MVDLVRAVVEGLERLGVEQGYQKIKAGIVIRDNGIQGAFLLAQGVEIHVVVVGDGLDLGQVEGGPAGRRWTRGWTWRSCQRQIVKDFLIKFTKNLQKRCQKHCMAPDTSFDRLHFSVQQSLQRYA